MSPLHPRFPIFRCDQRFADSQLHSPLMLLPLVANQPISCVAAPLNPAYNSSEVSFYLSDTQSKLVVVPSGATSSSPLHPAVVAARELRIPVAEIHFDGRVISTRFEAGSGKTAGGGGTIVGSGRPREDDVALVLHTSGTTGRPKAVPLSHLNLYTTMENVARTYKLQPSDRTYLVMPLFHVRFLFTILPFLRMTG